MILQNQLDPTIDYIQFFQFFQPETVTFRRFGAPKSETVIIRRVDDDFRQRFLSIVSEFLQDQPQVYPPYSLEFSAKGRYFTIFHNNTNNYNV